MEHLFGVFGFRTFRCHACQHRWQRFRYAELSPVPATAAEAEVRGTRNALKWKRKRRELLLYGFGLCLFLALLYYILTREGSGPSDPS